MSTQGWVRALTAVISALGRRGTGATGGTETRKASRRPTGSSGSQPRLRARSRSTEPAAEAARYAESPGQFGPGATRDLTAAEIAALRPSYDPTPDDEPDPGEIVWTWVPYEENDGRGKDRPVLVFAQIDRTASAACYLSTKQHDGFISIGRGPWDSQGRESFLSTERVLRVTDTGMRREGTVVPQERFIEVVRVISRVHGLR